MPDLLIELLSEEIPARMQPRAASDLRRLVTDGLVEAGLTYRDAAAFATPRRLALTVEGLGDRSRSTREERKGPAANASEAAIQGFLRSTGLRLDQLERRSGPKGDTLFAVTERPGREAPAIVAEVLERAIRAFPWPKSMRWGEGTLRWVRPLQSILCLLVRDTGAEVVPLDVDGLVAGDTTRGHRVHAPEPFSVSSFEDYESKLKRAHVILRPEERAARIRHDAATLAFARGAEVVEDDALLQEIAGLVEWPVTLMGRVEDQFLSLPPEVLQTSMKEHQKFLSVRGRGGIEGFVTVANIDTPDDGATILAGNQRVLRARLSDAAFFWENDLRVAKAGMKEWEDGLKSVTFHNRLGSQWDRVERIAALAREIAPAVGADPDMAERAARLAKLDLRSAMVGEFPELQGLMGRYYIEAAQRADWPAEVARAAQEHYSPLGPSDAVPTARVSVAVALADKLDTLTGFWTIDEKPTGSKDPFALRRAALGVLRIILTRRVRLALTDALKAPTSRHQLALYYASRSKLIEAVETVAVGVEVLEDASEQLQASTKAYAEDDAVEFAGDHFPGVADALTEDLLAFLHDRLKVHLLASGIPHDVLDAALALPNSDDLTLLTRRAEALSAFLKTPDGENLVQLYKRAANILSQAEERDPTVEYSYGADPRFFEAPEEHALLAALDEASPPIRDALAREDFPAAMSGLAGLRAPMDAFFESVQVNADNGVLRRNRLNLLSRIRALCLDVADLSKIEG